MLKKITISPESTNYGDNDANVAYLYRGYIIWRETHIYVGDRGGNRDDWNFSPAVLHAPDAELGEDFEPFWDDTGLTETCESRRDCVARIDKRLDECRVARLAWEAEQAAEPAKEPALVDFLVEFGLELTEEVGGVSRYVRDNVRVGVDTVGGRIEVVALESDGFTEKRRLCLPVSRWPVHAAAEIVRAVLRERHS
jgi:hypothetical protein